MKCVSGGLELSYRFRERRMRRTTDDVVTSSRDGWDGYGHITA